ncbi:pilus assembly protein [Mariniluteicoccus endophyticus]
MRLRDERGAASIEAVLLVPALVMVVACLVGGARVWHARAAVSDAAYAAARAASLERAPGAAVAAAQATARRTVGDRQVACVAPRTSVDAGGFSAPVGQPARVRVTVACEVPMADLFGLPLPGTLDARADATSALDTYRGRR